MVDRDACSNGSKADKDPSAFSAIHSEGILSKAHKEGCLWPDTPTPARFFCFPDGPFKYHLQELKRRIESFVICQAEHNVIACPPTFSTLNQEALAFVRDFVDMPQASDSSIVLGLLGWEAEEHVSSERGTPYRQRCCSLCGMKGAVHDKPERHQWFCPWVNSEFAQIDTPTSSMLTRQSDGNTPSRKRKAVDMCGWEWLLWRMQEQMSTRVMEMALSGDEKDLRRIRWQTRQYLGLKAVSTARIKSLGNELTKLVDQVNREMGSTASQDTPNAASSSTT